MHWPIRHVYLFIIPIRFTMTKQRLRVRIVVRQFNDLSSGINSNSSD